MMQARSLKAQIVWQFVAILLPMVALLAYDTVEDYARAKQLDKASRQALLVEASAQAFQHFLDGVVDAVDSAKLAAPARLALDESHQLLTQVTQMAQPQAPLEIEKTLGAIESLQKAIPDAAPLALLLPLRRSINETQEQLTSLEAQAKAHETALVRASLEDASQQIYVVAGTATLSILLTLFFIARMIRGLTEPLQRAVRAARTIADGDLTSQPNLNAQDDLDGLMASLEHMRLNLSAYHERMLRQQQELQQRVDERTRSLAETAKRATALAQEAWAANNAKSTFLAAMSHEIRTPMNGVLGMTEVLLGSPLDAQQQLHAQTIYRSGQSLLVILNEILDFSKIEAGKIEIEWLDFNLHQVIEDSLRLLRQTAQQKNLQLHCHLDAKLPEVALGDPMRLRQVITNLVGNAIKFTHEGEVSLAVSPVPGRRSPQGDPWYRFEVSDTGVGIDSASIHKLFAPFSQADASTTRRYGGTGLGLAISKQLVELWGGQIGVTSQSGVGSQFWFELPLGHAMPTAALPTAAGADPGAALVDAADVDPGARRGAARARLLLVEDNEVNQLVALALLESLQLDICTAMNGAEAVGLVSAEHFDLVLMDCQMPEMDGFTATRSIRQSFPDRYLPIVALTANAMTGDLERCLAAGMDDYLAKPFNKDQLLTKVCQWLREPVVE